MTLTIPTPAPPVLLLTRDDAPLPESLCVCGGLLSYVRGAWRHVDQCLQCLGLTCGCGRTLVRVPGGYQHLEQVLVRTAPTPPGARRRRIRARRDCPQVRPATCPAGQPHVGCENPEPVTCVHEATHNCQGAVSLEAACAYGNPPRSCCGCCLSTDED